MRRGFLTRRLGADITAKATSVSFSDLVTNGERFYRVVQVN